MENQIESQKSGKGTKFVIFILVLAVLGLGGYIAYDKLYKKDVKEPKKVEKKKTEEKENLDAVATTLVSKLDKYYVDYYDSKENVTFDSLPVNDKMLGSYVYGKDDLSKSVVDDYFNNLFGVKLSEYPDLNCWAGDGAFYKYNSATEKYEVTGNHGHGGLTSVHSVAMKYNDIQKDGDNYVVTVTKVYGPAQGIGLESPENAFYADSKYTVKIDELGQFVKTDSIGNMLDPDSAGAKSYYEQNYDKFKNIKPQYKYTFKKSGNDFYLVSYQIVK